MEVPVAVVDELLHLIQAKGPMAVLITSCLVLEGVCNTRPYQGAH